MCPYNQQPTAFFKDKIKIMKYKDIIKVNLKTIIRL